MRWADSLFPARLILRGEGTLFLLTLFFFQVGKKTLFKRPATSFDAACEEETPLLLGVVDLSSPRRQSFFCRSRHAEAASFPNRPFFSLSEYETRVSLNHPLYLALFSSTRTHCCPLFSTGE